MGRLFFATVSVALAALSITSPSTASAQRMRMPVSYQQRPMTLPAGTLRPTVGSTVSVIRGRPGNDAWLHADAGLGVGVTRSFELGVLFLPLRLAPNSRYGSTDPGLPPIATPWFGHQRPDVYGRYRFLDGDVEIGLDLHMILPAPEDFHLVAGVPFLFRISDFMRIDVGMYVQTRVFERAWGYLPLVLSFNPSRRFFFGFDGGLTVEDDPTFPLGFFLGFTLGSKPTADIKVGSRMLDVEHGFDVWLAWMTLDFYIFL